MPLTTQELRDRNKKIYDIFENILSNPNGYAKMSAEFQTQLVTGLNKAYGQAEAYELEFRTSLAGDKKGRKVVTQTHGDVSIGNDNDLFAKTVECKSVTAATNTAVKKQLEKALEQVAGNTGALPRDFDARVIDLKINCLYNPWPMPGGAYGTLRKAELVTTLRDNAIAAISDLLKAQEQNSVRTWLKGENLDDAKETVRLGASAFPAGPMPYSYSAKPTFVTNPNSSRPVAVTANEIRRVRSLTVKIRYDPVYVVSPGQGKPNVGLEEIVVQSYKDKATNKIVTRCAKVVYWEEDVNKKLTRNREFT